MQRLLNDSEGDHDKLPVFQHILKMLCENRSGELDLTLYEKVGGWEHALKRDAEQVLRHSPNELSAVCPMFQWLQHVRWHPAGEAGSDEGPSISTWIHQDPPLVARVPYFPKLTEGDPRKGFLKPESYQKLLFELPEELRLLFVVAYHVGLRKGALLRIKWSQVDLKTNTIWMDGRKRNRKPEPVAVPIYGDMVKFIEMQPQTSEYLFARAAKPIRDFRESWALACRRAGVPGLLFHDLRRTAVRNLRRAGVQETVIMKITGDRTRSILERYNITDETDTREAGLKAGEYLAKEQEEVAQITSQKPERPN